MKNKCLALVFGFLVSASPSLAQVANPRSEKAQNIEHLLQLVGADKLQQAVVDQMLATMLPSLSNAPGLDADTRRALGRLADLLREEMKKVDFNSLTAQLYDKYFTNDEVRELIRFYESAIGQKAIQVLPALTQESMERGGREGQLAAQRAMARFVEEYPELRKLLQPTTTR